MDTHLGSLTHSLTPEQLKNPRCFGTWFDDATPVMTVARTLRKAWLLHDTWIEGEPLTRNPTQHHNIWLQKLIDRLEDSSEEEVIAIRNPDRDDTSTPFRESLYHVWNHVFVDAARVFAALCDTGSFIGPNYETVDIRFPETDDEEGEPVQVAEFSYDTNIMLVPAFLEPGFELQGQLENEGEGVPRPTHDSDDGLPRFSFNAIGYDWVYLGKVVYWIKAGEKVHLFLPKRADMAGKLACVLVCGRYPGKDFRGFGNT